MIAASPWPPPPHSAAAPSAAAAAAQLVDQREHDAVPDMPTGWPSAIAPPLTLTIVVGDAEVAHRRDADRGERLVELEQVDVGDRHVVACSSARLIARDGW